MSYRDIRFIVGFRDWKEYEENNIARRSYIFRDRTAKHRYSIL